MAISDQAPAAEPIHVPGRKWYFIAPIFFIVGVAAMAFVLFEGLSGISSRMIRVVVPGEAELNLDQPGSYTIFHEYQSTVGTRVFAVQSVADLTVTVRSKTTGQTIALEASDGNSKYSFDGRSGRSIWTFQIVEPGSYFLVAAYGSGRNEPQTVLTVVRGFVGSLLFMIGAALALFFAGLAGTIGLSVFVSRRRRKARLLGVQI